VIDFLGMMGDAADNIQDCLVCRKYKKFLKEYGSWRIFCNTDKLLKGKMKENIGSQQRKKRHLISFSDYMLICPVV
jgi:5'-3' exonuclease